MVTFPLDDGACVAIISPGNIKRLKSGRPMKVGDKVLVAFTPNIRSFVEKLGIKTPLPASGERIECRVHITPEQIEFALVACKDLIEED